MIYLIFAFAFILRLINLNQSFWLDEAINTLAIKENSLYTLITQYALGDFHPPLYHIFLWLWTRIFGFTEVGVRMLSVLFGWVTVILCFLLFRRIFTRSVALLTTLFLATSPLHIYYSQEARMYAFTTFFALLSIYFFIEIIRHNIKAQKSIWFGYFFSTLLLLYSEYLPYFLILSQNLIFFWLRKKVAGGTVKKWIGNQFLLFVCLLPWLPFFFQQFQIASAVAQEFTLWNEVVGKATVKSFLLLPVKFLIGRISLENKMVYGLFIFPLILGIGGLFLRFFLKKRHEISSFLLFLFFFLPLLFAFTTSLFISVFSYFRFLFLLPLFYLILGISIETLGKKPLRMMVILCLLIVNFVSLLFFYTNKHFWRENWKGVVAFIESQDKNSLALMVNPAQNAGYKYYSKAIVPLVYGLDNEITQYHTLWLFRYVQPIFDPQDKVRQNIEKAGFQKKEEYDFTGVVVWRYTKL